LIGNNPPVTAAWGYCDRDYPREEIVSPYPYRSAAEHFRAMQEDVDSRGGPTRHTQATLPDWSGRYVRQNDKRSSWFNGGITQIPTYLSLLTPEYQQRFVQQAYHYAADNTAQWPGSYCWPEGFMRRFSQYSGATVSLLVTTDLVMDMRNGAKTMITQIHIGREFDESGVVPRLGPDVPQWFGETVGYWDGEALVTWTSNIQGWIAHGSFEYSNKLQTIEIYTPRHDDSGNFLGLHHEAILYDEEALADPVRIVHVLDHQRDFSEGDPFAIIECIPQSYPIDGQTTPTVPGQTFEFRVPDILGRPWADIWEHYHEEGMEKPAQATGRFGI
jgi:hypothetical protein